jgi:hypothetical protein
MYIWRRVKHVIDLLNQREQKESEGESEEEESTGGDQRWKCCLIWEPPACTAAFLVQFAVCLEGRKSTRELVKPFAAQLPTSPSFEDICGPLLFTSRVS